MRINAKQINAIAELVNENDGERDTADVVESDLFSLNSDLRVTVGVTQFRVEESGKILIQEFVSYNPNDEEVTESEAD
jgi:hypothetical protein